MTGRGVGASSPRHRCSEPAGLVTVTTSGGIHVELGPPAPAEVDDLFAIFARIVAAGEGFPQRHPVARAEFDTFWVQVTALVVARVQGDVVGGYHLKPNFVGRGAHIANAGYALAPAWRGRGIGRAMVEDSISRAPEHGFDALQFNLVFASNPARALYAACGFVEIGRVPRAVDGEDAVIYWRAVG